MDINEKHAYVSGAQDMLDAVLEMKSTKPGVRSKLLEKFHEVARNATTKMTPKAVVIAEVLPAQEV